LLRQAPLRLAKSGRAPNEQQKSSLWLTVARAIQFILDGVRVPIAG
jgi:hypothetical protein